MFTVKDIDERPITRQATARLSIDTRGQAMVEITDSIRQWISSKGFESGLLTILCQHTSASLTIQENADPDVQKDLLTALDSLAPRGWQYVHSYEGPDDMPAHIRTMLTGSCLSVPVFEGSPVLGTWQGVYLIEHRDHAHRRHVVLQFIGS
jgi:secondary thiamine-phosphate synthase enzyme